MSIRSMMIGGAGASPPGAPTGVSATSGDDTTSSISFSAPANNGGSAITGYRVTASPGGATFTGSSSPITATGLTNGTTYTFTVAAQNAIGYGAESSGATGTPTAVVINLTIVNERYGPFGPPNFSDMSISGTGQSALNPVVQDGTGNITGGEGIYRLTLPAGTYTLKARGAGGPQLSVTSGGDPVTPTGGGGARVFGRGAEAIGTFTFASSQNILILVGQRGRSSNPAIQDITGSGGTFITLAPNSSGTAYQSVQQSDVLLVGGGASARVDGGSSSQINGNTNSAGQSSTGGSSSPSNGPGSDGYGGIHGCGAGASGFRGNGGQQGASTGWGFNGCGYEGFGADGSPSGNSQAFINGGKGGRYSGDKPNGPGGGGFGGGAAQGNNGIGGGGGYSGGSSTYAASENGGGGGSYVKSTASSSSIAVVSDTDVGGRVVITKL